MGFRSMCHKCSDWRWNREAMAYSGTAFAYSVMHPVFNFYYVKVFLDHYKISESSFHIVQILYMIWNAVNDPLFGYCQDHSSWKIVKSRRHTILYGAPFFALSFLIPWFPWKSYEANDWVCSLHLLVSLFFYDAMFTYVLLANSCLIAEMTKSHEDRIKMTQYAAVIVLLGNTSIIFTEQFSDHLKYFDRFQYLCVVYAIIAYLGLRYTGKNAVTLYDKDSKDSVHKHTEEKEDKHERATGKSIVTLTCQIIRNSNFFWFVTTNLLAEFHGTFLSNFLFIFIDILIPKETLPTILWSLFYGAVILFPKIFFLVMRPMMSTVGYYRIIRYMTMIKVVSGCIMLLLGRQVDLFFLVFLLIDSLMAHSMGSMFGLITSDIIEEDMRKHNRSHPLSSMVYGTNALITKPAQSIAPMLTVFLLNLNGYQQYKDGGMESTDNLKSVIFSMICLVTIVIGIGQYLSWSNYNIRNSHQNKVEEAELDFEQLL